MNKYELEQENKRLNVDMTKAVIALRDQSNAMTLATHRAMDAEAEVKRLRGALEEILHNDRDQAWTIASEALEAK